MSSGPLRSTASTAILPLSHANWTSCPRRIRSICTHRVERMRADRSPTQVRPACMLGVRQSTSTLRNLTTGCGTGLPTGFRNTQITFRLRLYEFEQHGFIWGGRWAHYDTMHFEYRPELLGGQ